MRLASCSRSPALADLTTQAADQAAETDQDSRREALSGGASGAGAGAISVPLRAACLGVAKLRLRYRADGDVKWASSGG